jgi:hypothetical protein
VQRARRRQTEDVTTPRARARAEMTDQITQIARRRLASEGPDLSSRAVARDLGGVSSPVYRYFARQDELPTAGVAGILRDGVERGLLVPTPRERLPRAVRADLESMAAYLGL